MINGDDTLDELLLQAQRDFSERMSLMGTLSGGLAHEINNPLASVLANLATVDDSTWRALPPGERGSFRPSIYCFY